MAFKVISFVRCHGFIGKVLGVIEGGERSSFSRGCPRGKIELK